MNQLAQATLAGGETIDTRRAEAFDPDPAGKHGMGFERLAQVALEHFYGER